jgi:hypothetical protein
MAVTTNITAEMDMPEASIESTAGLSGVWTDRVTEWERVTGSLSRRKKLAKQSSSALLTKFVSTFESSSRHDLTQ